MARFYPALAGDFHGSEGEQQAYRALETLGDDYMVFHSYCWLGDGVRTATQGRRISSCCIRGTASSPLR